MTDAEVRGMPGKVRAAIEGQPSPAGQMVREWIKVMAEDFFSQEAKVTAALGRVQEAEKATDVVQA